MAAPSLDNEFMQYWSKLTPVEKESLLYVARNYVQLKEESGHISIEQYNKEIDEALEEVAAGNYMTQEEIEKESEKW